MTFDYQIFVRYVVEFMMIIPAAVMAIIPVRNFLKVKKRYLATLILTIFPSFIILGSAVCTIYDITSNIVIFPFTVIIFAIYSKCFELSLPKKLFCFTNATMICSFSNMYSVFATAPIELGNLHKVLHISSGLVCIGVSILIGAMLFRTIAFKLPELLLNNIIDRVWNWLAIIPIFMTCLCIWMEPVSPENAMVGRIRKVSMIILLLIPIVTWFLFHIQWLVTKIISENAELQRSNDILQLEEKQYLRTLQSLEETRNLRHDFRQHLLVIKDFAQNGDTKALIDYIEPFIKSSNELHHRYFSNYALDAVASHYIELAEKQKTKIYWNIKISDDMPFKLSDICAMLGNLLENSLHATAQLPEDKREIRIAMAIRLDSVLIISISNPYNGVIKIDKEGLPMSKGDGHGIGLRSVTNTVKRYNGSISIDTNNGIFDVGIILNS